MRPDDDRRAAGVDPGTFAAPDAANARDLQASTARVIGAAAIVLVATGVGLAFLYEPSRPGVSTVLSNALRVTHEIAAMAMLGFTAVLAGLSAWHRLRTAPTSRPGHATWLLPTLAIPVIVAGSITGFALAWDQLAYVSVVSFDTVRGVVPQLFDADVRFFIVDDVEIQPTTMRIVAAVHLVVLPAGLVALARWWRRP